MSAEAGSVQALMDKIVKIRQFLKEAKIELKRVVWPTPKEALISTSVVVVFVIIVSLFLGVVDFGLTKIIKLILG
jgi:protein translocase subunit secE/sec61 gamma